MRSLGRWILGLLILASFLVIGGSALAVTLTQMWVYPSPADIIDVAVSDDGRIVGFTTEAGAGTGAVSTATALENGAPKWQYRTGGRLCSLDVSNDGGLVTVASYDYEGSTVSLLSTSDGKVLWKKPFWGIGQFAGQGDFVILVGSVGDSESTMMVDKRGHIVAELPDTLRLYVSGGGRYYAHRHYQGLDLVEVPHRVVRQFPNGEMAAISDTGHLIAVAIEQDADPIAVLQLYQLDGQLLWAKEIWDPQGLDMAGDGSAILAVIDSRERHSVTVFDEGGNLLWDLGLGSDKIEDQCINPRGDLFALAFTKPDSKGELRLYGRDGTLLASQLMPEGATRVQFTREGRALVVASQRHIYFYTLK